jgi:HAD superfamily hydrolase (TIGR01484 family)
MMENSNIPKPLSDLNSGDTSGLKYVLTDVDDTITTKGRLLPSALQSLWDLHEQGLKIIPVTGGSAGWADVYFRQWPIDAIITESGALAWYRKDGVRKRIDFPTICQEGYRKKADHLIKRVLTEVPNSKLSVDQFCRIYDIAFDHHEEEPYLNQDGIVQILDICTEEGASFGVSSIHVNCWFGAYSKLDMVRYLLKEVYGLEDADMKQQIAYCGDAPNDSPLFDFFPFSFGVANVLSSSIDMPVMPAYCADNFYGKGFSEIASKLISCR